ncbi:MAG: cupin domain-containing protein [Defluviicoccus sp.]|nr:cupin domain-containing protein [Defluviicoccus sp.]
MVAAVRRVVTGHRDGRAVVVIDGDAPNMREREHGTGATQLWRTFATPADNAGAADPVTGDVPLAPPPGGSVFRIVEFAPESAISRGPGGGTLARALGAHEPEGAALRHPGSHRTDSVDYAVVVSGEIDLWLDDPEDDVHLTAGDVVIQRGTNHAWVNRGTEPCRIAFVLIDAKPAV